MLWYIQAAIYISFLVAQHSILCVEKVPNIWYFAWNLSTEFGRNDTVGTNHKGFVDPARSSASHHYIILEEGNETLKHQWVSLLLIRHPIPIPSAENERGPKIWYISWKLRVVFGRDDVMWAIRGSNMLSKAFLSIHIHLRKAMTHSNSNGCLFLQHIIIFSMRRGYLKSDILCENLD